VGGWKVQGRDAAAGGGNFGVVTSFVFRTVPAPAATVFHLVWPLAHAAAAVEAWQAWAPTAPDALDATLRLTAGGGARPPLADVFGAVLACEAKAAELLGELIARVSAEPALASRRHLPYREAKRYLDGLEPVEGQAGLASPDQAPQQGTIFSKSKFFRRPLPRDTIAALVENLTRELAGSHSREVSFLPWGGAYNRVRADATALAHRAELSSSSIWPTLSQVPPGPKARLPAADWRDHGHSCIHRDQGACTRTSPTQISRTGLAPTTARTTAGRCASRPNATQTTSSAFTNRFQVSPREVGVTGRRP